MPRLKREAVGLRQLQMQAEAAALDAFTDLIAFVNLNPQITDWRGWNDPTMWRVHGDPCLDVDAEDRYWRLKDLHGEIHAALKAVVEGRFTLGFLTPISSRWAYTSSAGVRTFPPQDELDEYLLWAILHGLATGRHFRQCQAAECSRFFLGKTARSKYCSTGCHDADAPRRKQEQTRIHGRAWRKRTSLRGVKKAIR